MNYLLDITVSGNLFGLQLSLESVTFWGQRKGAFGMDELNHLSPIFPFYTN